MTISTEVIDPEPTAPSDGDRTEVRRLLAVALSVGAVAQLGLRGGLANAVVAAAVVLAIGALVVSGRLRRRAAVGSALAALVPAAFLALRHSPWLAGANAAGVAVLVVTAVLHAETGAVTDTTVGRLTGRARLGLRAGGDRIRSLPEAVPALSSRQRERSLAVSYSVLVAVPVAAVLVALLSAADAVFASLVTPEVDGGPLVGHVVATVLVGVVFVGLVGSTAARTPEADDTGRLGAVEVVTMLSVVAAVLAAFVVSQLVALTSAGERAIASAGLTPAEYARSGFFQLCWATAIVLGFVAVVRAMADPVARRRRSVRWLSALVPLLGTGLVVVSLRRMALYDQAFGLTMLRLAVVAAALWMGVVLVLGAARNAGVGAGRQWLLSGAGGAALVVLMVANLLNPEALVVRHNLDRARDGAALDVGYLATLSDDAVPALADAVAAEGEPERRALLVRALGCEVERAGAEAVNTSVRRAAAVRAEVCPPS